MPRKSSPPTVTPGRDGALRYEHDSYATVKFSRCSGQTELFNSPFSHQHFITMSIGPAIKETDGSHDFIFADNREYIEVWMSETQFAQAITSMNMGSGSPCTLVRLGSQAIDAPEREDVINSHKEMVKEKLGKVMDQQIATAQKVKEWREAKHRPTLKELDGLLDNLTIHASNFESNMGWYAQCFEEHMEKVVGSAKAEIESHLLASADRLGVDSSDLPALGFQE